MSYETLHNTIRSRFGTKVETPYLSGKVMYDNAPFSEPGKTNWCRFTILPGDSEQEEFGGDTVKERIPGLVSVASVWGLQG